MSVETESANRQIARAAGVVMTAFIISQLVGLIRRMLVADVFGTQAELDAFSIANRFSEILFNLVAGGALGSAFIPTFTGLLVKGDRKSAWKLASAIGNLIFIILSALAALSFLFAPQLLRTFFVDPAFAADAAKFSLTVNLMRIQLASAVLFGISGLIMGILNAHQVFLIPALTPSLYQLGMIFGVLVLEPYLGIYGLAWGVVAGAAGHLLLQIPVLLRQRGRYHFSLGLGDPDVREVITLMGPRLLGVAVVQLNFVVNAYLASGMAEGSVVGVEYGFAIMIMAQAAIAQSIATAAMPTLAAQFARGALADVKKSLAASLRGVLLLAVPASVGLMLLREPVVAMLYQRGKFDDRSVQLVAWALLWYAAGLVGHSVLEVLARAFYAMHDTRTPVTVGVVAMSLNVVFSFWFAARFREAGWMPHGGLALANSLATTLEAVGLLALARRRLKGLEGRRVLLGLAQAVLSAGLMAVTLWAWLNHMSGRSPWVVGIGGIAVGAGVYGVMMLVLRVPEVRSVLAFIRRRVDRRA